MALDLLDGLGDGLLEIFARPIHWLLWGTGVLLCLAISLGRFQIEPFRGGEEWVPEEGRPILSTFGATTAGTAAWIIALAAIFRPYIL